VPPGNARTKPHLTDVSAKRAVPRAGASAPLPAAPRKGVAVAPPGTSARIRVAGALPPARIPPEALVSPRGNRLFATALALSLSLHAVAIALHFSPFDPRTLLDREPPLEITLVNAKSATRPTKADILAQANLDGGGNTDLNRRAKTPLPMTPKERPAKDLAVPVAVAETPPDPRTEFLTRMRGPSAAAQTVPPPTDPAERTDSPTANEMMQHALEALRLEAQIAKDWDAYQKRPKRRFIGANAEEYRFARYVEDWRLKVERIGNLNYPQAARQMKLYGSLQLSVSIRKDGSLENVEVMRSSGQRVLDAAAIKIVEMSAPFSAFPADVKRDTDILNITRTWTFTKGDELQSN
jgi:protein TonB